MRTASRSNAWVKERWGRWGEGDPQLKKTSKKTKQKKAPFFRHEEKTAVSNMHSIGDTTDEIKTQIQIKWGEEGGMFTASSRRIGWSLADGKARSGRAGGGGGRSSQNSRGVEAAGHEEDRRTSAAQVDRPILQPTTSFVFFKNQRRCCCCCCCSQANRQKTKSPF